MTSEQPITERVNPLSINIDVATPEEMVSILQKCDEEIFKGWENYPGLADRKIQQTISTVVDVTCDILKLGTDGAVVLSGCGTSGRLAFITSRTFNLKQREVGRDVCYHYIMAGGDIALFTSQEAIEDDPSIGIEQLHHLCKDKTKVLFIGITCGLSAPFVAGQLQLCMDNSDKYTAVVLGFNPSPLARNIPIEKWDKTFLQVVEKLENKSNCHILNPVIGPEAITGSTRMKSGSATKLLLEMIFMTAHIRVNRGRHVSIERLLKCYETVCDTVYRHKADIGRAVELAGKSLTAGGHVYYLSEDGLGLLGMIDASECPPTYGATLDDVRGFVSTGFDFLRNNEGDISNLGRHFRISLADFHRDIAPGITTDDVVVELTSGSPSISQLQDLVCRKLCVIVGEDTSLIDEESLKQFNAVVRVPLSRSALTSTLGSDDVTETWQVLREMATKWVLNAISTGAHILKGKVCQNIMVDLKVSNNKLFYRGIGIIQRFSKLSHNEAMEYLLRSIYGTDGLHSAVYTRAVAEHIRLATPQQRIIPTALMAALLQCPITEARAVLNSHPVIRTAISTSLEKTREHRL